MNVTMMPIEQVVPYARNPRKNEAAVAKVAASIREFGFRQPIVVDADRVVIVGHTRLLAARTLGLTEVPIHVAENLTPAQVRAYRLADNRTAQEAEWDMDLLALELQELDGANFDLALTGFGEEEILELLNGDGEDGILPSTDEDEAPEPPEDPVTVPGELITLGRHRLLCGDSTRLEDMEALMAGEAADLIWTDPPYNVAYEGKTKDALTIENDAMDDGAFRRFLEDAFLAMASVTRPGGAIYVAHADTEGHNFRGALREAGWLLKQCLVWVKNSMVLGRQDYHWRHEPILYGWKPGAAHRWFADRSQTTVLEYDRPTRSTDHPTMKPVELVAYCLANSSGNGDVVLDPFGGSGTTLIACEKLGRKARLMELDPRYCDVIIRRWEEATGRKAVRRKPAEAS